MEEGGRVAGKEEGLDQTWTSDPRAGVIARLSAELAVLAKAGDLEGMRCINETIARLLKR